MNPAFPPLPALPANPSAALTALVAMPVVRALAVRPTRIATVNVARIGNLEALYGQAVGTAAVNAPCAHCARNQGPWTLCVTVPGQLRSSCANCHFNSEGARFSFRKLHTVNLNRPEKTLIA
jgi:hypothetical protein